MPDLAYKGYTLQPRAAGSSAWIVFVTQGSRMVMSLTAPSEEGALAVGRRWVEALATLTPGPSERCRVRLGADLQLGADGGTDVVVSWAIEDEDTATMFAPPSEDLTIPTAGYYQLSAAAVLVEAPPQEMTLKLRVNGALVQQVPYRNEAAGLVLHHASLAVADAVSLVVNAGQPAGDFKTLDASHSYLQVVRLQD